MSKQQHIASVEAQERVRDAAEELLAALRECLDAEMKRRKKLKIGAPATTYSEARIARIRAAIAKATGAA